jgi:putative transcriptional regulator
MMDIDKMAKAIEKDAGIKLPDLKTSLEEVRDGQVGRSYSPEQLLLRSVRQKTGMSQAAFAALIKTPAATLRDWEQGRFQPPGGVVCLLELLDKNPDLIRDLAA